MCPPPPLPQSHQLAKLNSLLLCPGSALQVQLPCWKRRLLKCTKKNHKLLVLVCLTVCIVIWISSLTCNPGQSRRPAASSRPWTGTPFLEPTHIFGQHQILHKIYHEYMISSDLRHCCNDISTCYKSIYTESFALQSLQAIFETEKDDPEN